ncbi:MAG: isoprenylcysteine carboxylmethyltransferase family protein [Alphaproteobacteria bacterium]|nr:isoprenylcysteine carboxylmethyltransferase family protein [Alphaproteobacteria bacterium]
MSTQKAETNTDTDSDLDDFEGIVEPAEDEESASAPLDHPDIPMIPPTIFALFLIAGITLDWLVPINFGRAWGGIGLLMVAGGLGCIVWCQKLFARAGTNINPEKPTLSIVTDGPYKYSRNPIYLCFLVIYAGLGMLADAPVMLVLLGGLYYVLDTYVIQREEAYLARKFGEEYSDYQDSVRRWV